MDERRWLNDVTVYAPGQAAVKHRAPYVLGNVTCLAGEVDPFHQGIVAEAVSHCQTIAPWMAVVVAPDLQWKGCYNRGVCSYRTNTIFLSLHDGPPEIVATAYHEAWHGLERRLPGNVIEAIENELQPFFLEAYKYYREPHERRARLFANWCGCIFEGKPVPKETLLDAIFAAAWSGETAKEIDTFFDELELVA
ncbi:hypothetical protein BB934_45725 (plasmid) [Microvirga ossetica]|uniref:Uncharacterized protein n=1 Tax=Microvirga ossetica TaxID=1882682 RepID=A0A1B2EZW6_9HYPH|nr:hypothetical protein [Microvirga ossetica]ANY85521.1 hypothetical protein BB934_45725 [Microvirga ossetica]